MPNDEKLTPADPSDLTGSIAFALCFDGRKRFHEGDKLMANITAKRVLSVYLSPEAWKQLRMLSLNLGNIDPGSRRRGNQPSVRETPA
jgi:hypothetical protein